MQQSMSVIPGYIRAHREQNKAAGARRQELGLWKGRRRGGRGAGEAAREGDGEGQQRQEASGREAERRLVKEPRLGGRPWPRRPGQGRRKGGETVGVGGGQAPQEAERGSRRRGEGQRRPRRGRAVDGLEPLKRQIEVCDGDKNITFRS